MGKRSHRVAAAFLVLLVSACADRESNAPGVSESLVTTATSPAVRHHGRVVLITIDGVRWQDVFEGSNAAWSGGTSVPPQQLMPRAHALVAKGGVAIGATLDGCGVARTTGASNVSLPGYQEIFTGHASYCLDNACAQVGGTVLDEAAADGIAGVASIGSWDVLTKAVSSSARGVFVSEGRSWPDASTTGTLATLVAQGQAADPFPGHDGYRPDHETAPIALAYFRANKPALMHIGLGDTDEYGHRSDYASYLAALLYADSVIGDVADTLATMGEDGKNTTVIVTPDHGRNSDFTNHGVFRPESGRTFVLAFGGDVATQGVACPAGDVTLSDIAPTIRRLMGLPTDTSDGAGQPFTLITEKP